MKRKIVIAAAILALLPIVGCQRIARLPEVFGKRVGMTAPTSPPASTQAFSRSVNTGALQQQTLSVGGLERSYYIYVPASAAGKPAPMVMAFHGGGGNAQKFGENMNLVGMAERRGMILVLPQGVGRGAKKGGSWNADSMAPQGYAELSGVDDLGFVKTLLSTISANYSVDRSRIYAVGFSKGGMIAYRAACVLNGQFSAVVAVGSTLSAADCPNPKGVSVLHIHGTNDQNVPLNGGTGQFTGKRANYPSVRRGLDFFTAGNQCATQKTTTRPASDTTCTIQSCDGSEQVQLCLVEGGGHAWPGSPPANWQIKNNIYVSKNFDATDYIGNFLLSQ